MMSDRIFRRAGPRQIPVMARLVGAVAALLAVAPVYAATVPPQSGTISIQAVGDDAAAGDSSGPFVEAAGRSWADRGFTPLDGRGHAAFEVDLSVSHEETGTGSGAVARSKSDMANGGALGSVGAGIRIPIPSGKSRLVALERTRLEMTLRKRGDAAVIWRGAAVTIRPVEARTIAVADLCSALLRAYPEQQEGAIGVP